MEHKIQLENFYGPLDLLLHLVKESELDITTIPISRIAEQYCTYISMMQKLDIDMAGEFLVMASHLMLIKSRTLLPPPEEEEGEEEDIDPSLDLIKKLLEYKKYKDRSRELGRMMEERSVRHGRPPLKIEEEDEGKEEGEPLKDVELWDIVLCYSKIVKQTLLDVPMEILSFDIPIEVFVRKIEETLASRGAVNFMELIGDTGDKGRVIGTFLALLEMIKEQRIRAEQDGQGGEITIISCNPASANLS